MAARLDQPQLDALPLTPYPDVRPTLRPGDLLFASGRYEFSRLIQVATKSAWSHVGIICPVPHLGRVLVLESVEDVGVRLVPVSRYLTDYDNAGHPYDGAVAFGRVEGLTPDAARAVIGCGLDALGRPYDKDVIASIAVRLALGGGAAAGAGPRRAYVCSELVQTCFARGGVEFASSPAGFATPGGIWADPRVEFLARVR